MSVYRYCKECDRKLWNRRHCQKCGKDLGPPMPWPGDRGKIRTDWEAWVKAGGDPS